MAVTPSLAAHFCCSVCSLPTRLSARLSARLLGHLQPIG